MCRKNVKDYRVYVGKLERKRPLGSIADGKRIIF
jgi:hypothetical protein